jgi:hypothetical protein
MVVNPFLQAAVGRAYVKQSPQTAAVNKTSNNSIPKGNL